ncbi:arylsulfotransferase (ASST) [Sphingobacterium spiritivorum ATCC 33300]|uniref:Arylsulfotransferase (ASST) n=1 Tax=Sphingobacterium spiritivorum ATCC 33300 TaxID=525372 RepID=C2G194_SPHSI|nr:aryl-sulfate sulfotransferase [Sphingobacterium spiritivorum]EEI91071.1 arylsulfotransferase (ASST) [Sphingobacterium spiritivorum ATCC 33300]QQS97701.1 aryl-sulfate sulfotransferase [Sphingobacterium spiritivorum]
MSGQFLRRRFTIQMLFTILLLSVSCRDDKTDTTSTDLPFHAALEAMIDKGALLQKYLKGAEYYVFYFETGEVSVPASVIKEVKETPELWSTQITFTDQQALTIPSKGTKLDFIVKDIVLDPTGYNPLAAMVDVLLPATGRIRVIVKGKSGEQGTITHLLQTQTPRQQVPVLGLYANYNNEVELVFTDKDGLERGRTSISIRTKPLDISSFPSFEIITAQTARMEPGVNLVSYPGESELDTSCPYMLDADGEIRWILLLKKSPELQYLAASIGLKRLKNGNFLSGDMYQNRIVELDLFGKLVRQWDLKKLGYTFHHEVSEAKNGNFLITVTKSSARLNNGKPRINDHIIELNPTSGSLVHEWDLVSLLDSARYDTPDANTPQQFAQTASNWAHNNSIAERGNDLLATLRYQGITSFNPSNKLKWIISPHKGWGAAYQPYLLQPLDKQGQPVTDPKVISGEVAHPDFDWPWGPHTPVVMPNGNILVFDNGYNRHFKPNDLSSDQSYSRVVEYAVDEVRKTVQQVWAYGQNRGRRTFSQALSGVQYLSQTGNILFCPGMGTVTNKGSGGHIIEIDGKTKEVIYELEISSPSYTAFHRVTRLSLYPDNL